MKKDHLSRIVPKTILHSRVHPLRSFTTPHGTCFVKREDELGFGVSGSKARKYLSFLPDFLKHKPDEAILIGSAYSNHVLSFAQLLKENGVEPWMFLLGDADCKLQGNLLLSLLITNADKIRWISRKKWHEVDAIAADFAAERLAAGKKALVVPKGANCPSALPGAITLALDILHNEEQLGCAFDHIFIDAGTGLTACALILALAYLGKQTFVHVVQVAGTPEEFAHTLELRKKDFETLLQDQLPSPQKFKLYPPTIAPSFGAVNTEVLKAIADVGRAEGFLTDPVFTAKLFCEGKKIISQEVLQGNILFIHSGGGLGLMGFQDQLAKLFTLDTADKSASRVD